MSNLSQDEKEILDAFESGNVKSIKQSKKLIERHKQYAKATLRKDARINIRISSKDLETLQKRAIIEGIPYQTLISSILHKYAEGRLRESD